MYCVRIVAFDQLQNDLSGSTRDRLVAHNNEILLGIR